MDWRSVEEGDALMRAQGREKGKGPRPKTEVGDDDGPRPPIDDEDGKGIESRVEPSCGDLVGRLSRGGDLVDIRAKLLQQY